jgi:hypothetical protein
LPAASSTAISRLALVSSSRTHRTVVSGKPGRCPTVAVFAPGSRGTPPSFGRGMHSRSSSALPGSARTGISLSRGTGSFHPADEGCAFPFRDLFSPRARACPPLPWIPAHATFSSFPKDRERDELEDAERYHPRREPEAPKHLVRRASRRPPFGRPWRFPTAGLRKARPALPVPSPLGRPSLRTGAGAGRTRAPKAGRATAGLLAASVDRSTVRIIVGAP